MRSTLSVDAPILVSLRRDLQYRLLEAVNPRHPLRRPEFPPIRRNQQSTRRYLSSDIPDEDPYDRRVLCGDVAQKNHVDKVACAVFSGYRCWYRSDTDSIYQPAGSHQRHASRQRPRCGTSAYPHYESSKGIRRRHCCVLHFRVGGRVL